MLEAQALPAKRTDAPRTKETIAFPPRLSGHLELRAVTFGYNRTVEEPLIKSFSLVVKPGRESH
jgi:hypothetical protein